jgi:hypothetical protein
VDKTKKNIEALSGRRKGDQLETNHRYTCSQAVAILFFEKFPVLFFP